MTTTNFDAYQADLNDILNALGILIAYAPAGKTKKTQMERKQFMEAVEKIRSTANLMKNDYVPVEMEGGD
jgi:hypothetical protein